MSVVCFGAVKSSGMMGLRRRQYILAFLERGSLLSIITHKLCTKVDPKYF